MTAGLVGLRGLGSSAAGAACHAEALGAEPCQEGAVWRPVEHSMLAGGDYWSLVQTRQNENVLNGLEQLVSDFEVLASRATFGTSTVQPPAGSADPWAAPAAMIGSAPQLFESEATDAAPRFFESEATDYVPQAFDSEDSLSEADVPFLERLDTAADVMLDLMAKLKQLGEANAAKAPAVAPAPFVAAAAKPIAAYAEEAIEEDPEDYQEEQERAVDPAQDDKVAAADPADGAQIFDKAQLERHPEPLAVEEGIVREKSSEAQKCSTGDCLQGLATYCTDAAPAADEHSAESASRSRQVRQSKLRQAENDKTYHGRSRTSPTKERRPVLDKISITKLQSLTAEPASPKLVRKSQVWGRSGSKVLARPAAQLQERSMDAVNDRVGRNLSQLFSVPAHIKLSVSFRAM